MEYKDFYKHLVNESKESITFIQTDLNNGVKIGFVSKGDSGDRIRASNMRVSYKNKIHKWLIEMDKHLFQTMKFKPINVEIIFSVIPGDDNEHGRVHAYAERGDNKFFIRSDFLTGSYTDSDVVRTFIHEWSHIWHYQKSNVVDKLIEQKYELEKKQKNKRISPYGMTNHYEFWAYLVESYDKLDQELKQFVDQVIQKGK